MKPVLALIRTSPPQAPGSMSAYATLVQQALAGAEDPPFEVRCCDLFPLHAGRSMWFQHLWRIVHARRILSAVPADLYHLLDGSMCAFVPSAFRGRTVVTVHDLIPMLQEEGRLPGTPSRPAARLIRRTAAALAEVAGITTVSAHTGYDLERLTGRSDGVVISHAVRPLAGGAADEPADLPARYLLHVGNNALYKNRSGVLDVFARLQDVADLHLVMAGPEPGTILRRRAQGLQRVSFRVDVSDAELGALYRNASVFLFPSLYEGFGMPILEAMTAGCPVVCSDGGSLPEVAGDAALLAPAGDPDALARHCRSILESPALREDLCSRGRRHAGRFTMQRFSDALIAWYGKNLNMRQG